MTLLAIIMLVWAVGSYLLWGVMSRADGHVITIGYRDRAIALFWLPLCVAFALWALLHWAWEKGRCI